MRRSLFCFALSCAWGIGCAGAPEGTHASASAHERAGLEAFDALFSVFTHPRCLNCHPSDDWPRQGDPARVHVLGVERGPDGGGLPGMRCAACHGPNNQLNGVPGVTGWSLAPRSMGWAGRTRHEVCRQLKDPGRNGGRSLEATLHHLTEHPLVLWAWSPGVHPGGATRTSPPVPLEAYVRAAHTWIEHDGPCPPRAPVGARPAEN